VQLYDPTSSGAERNLSRAVALASLEGKTIGILENWQAKRGGDAARGGQSVCETERMRYSRSVFEIERERAGAVRDLGPGSGGGRFPNNRPR